MFHRFLTLLFTLLYCILNAIGFWRSPVNRGAAYYNEVVLTQISDVISLLCGVALFLFGMSLMGDGLKRVAGNKLEVILYKLSSTPLRGLLLGTGVTAVIQSSSATSVMVVGFVNSGMMKVRQAIGIIMGSIIGTSITGWIICLSYIDGASGWLSLISSSTLTGVIAVAGIILRMFCNGQTKHHLGDIFLGFAVLMTGMQSMSSAVSPLKESQTFLNMFTAFSNPLMGILVGTLFTTVLQSASAACGILQALVAASVIPFSASISLLMGIAIGASAPVLMSSVGATLNGRRTAFIYLVVEVVGVVVFGILFYGLNAIVGGFPFMNDAMTPFSVAALNTLFRLIKVVVLLPFIPQIEKIVDWLIRPKKGEELETVQLRPEERFLQHPSLAVEELGRYMRDMAAAAEDNLLDACNLVRTYSDSGYKHVEDVESLVDRYEDALGTYMVKLSAQELNKEQNRFLSMYLHTISDFERLSDHALNIADSAKERKEKNIVFSDSAIAELRVLRSAIEDIMQRCTKAFVECDSEYAKTVEPLEERIDDICEELKRRHIDRIQRNECTLLNGFVFNDLLSNFERVADHCSNIAVAVIELNMDVFDTHEYLGALKAAQAEGFTNRYKEFTEQYKLPK